MLKRERRLVQLHNYIRTLKTLFLIIPYSVFVIWSAFKNVVFLFCNRSSSRGAHNATLLKLAASTRLAPTCTAWLAARLARLLDSPTLTPTRRRVRSAIISLLCHMALVKFAISWSLSLSHMAYFSCNCPNALKAAKWILKGAL